MVTGIHFVYCIAGLYLSELYINYKSNDPTH